MNILTRGTGLGSLHKAERVLAEFRKIEPEILATQIQMFLLVAMFPGSTAKDLCERVGISQSSGSRNIAALGKVHRYGKPGYGLVQQEEDPRERRRKLITLTPKGRVLAAEIVKIMDG